MTNTNQAPPTAGAGEASIRAVQLTKLYGQVGALQSVSLDLGSNIHGLLGPNGSGKSTFLGLVSGQLMPTVGRVDVMGQAPFGNAAVLRHIGLCPEADALHDELTAAEFVAAMARLSGMNRADGEKAALAILDEVGLANDAHRRMGAYSRGMRQRVKIAQAMVHAPKVLLLDEPLTGIDPTLRPKIVASIRERAAAGTLVLFSTHVLPEVENITDNLVLLSRGQLVAHGRTHEIRALLDEYPHHVAVRCHDPRGLAEALLRAPDITSIQFPSADAVHFLTHEPRKTYRAVAEAAASGNYGVQALTSPDADLESVFHYLVERSQRAAGTGRDRARGAGVQGVSS